MSEYLTVEEAARQLGVEYKTVYHLIRRGEIPAGKIGRIYRIRRDDLESYFERQKEAVARQARGDRPTAASEIRCGGCGGRIVSELSIAGRCEQCGKAICQACWMVKKVRQCREHGEDSSGGETSPSLPAASPAVTTGDLSETEEAIRRLRREGKPVLQKGSGVVEEEAFLRNFAQRFEAVETLPDPLRDRTMVLRDARVKHTVEVERSGEGNVPGNRASIFRIKTGGWGKPMAQLFVEGRFRCHPERIETDGYDAEPISADELLALVNSVAETAQKDDAFHVILAAAPIGWAPDAVQAVTQPGPSSPLRDKRVGIALQDLASETIHIDEADERLWPFWVLLDPVRHEARVKQCVETIQQQLSQTGSISHGEATRLCKGCAEAWVVDAMTRIGDEDHYHLDDLEDVGLVLSASDK